jgi:pimeloyl-ACP methyl ester carboxylesterase
MQEQVLTLTGRKVHFWKGGSGPALLLLHAAWGDAEMSWSRAWEELSRSYTVIAPDLPGFGQSEKQSTPALSGMATMLKELLNALHLDRATVVGNSFGAGVAIKFENDHPQMVSQLVRAVKRSLDRFPEDFMFTLTAEEFQNLRCQFGTSSWGGGRYLPYAFTENGIAMLSGVLNSKRAVSVNIQIMRTFTKLRELLITHKDLKQRLDNLEKKYDMQFKVVFDAIRQLVQVPEPKEKKSGSSSKNAARNTGR